MTPTIMTFWKRQDYGEKEKFLPGVGAGERAGLVECGGFSGQ